MRLSRLALAAAICCQFCFAGEKPPEYYQKKATWQETLQLARESLVKWEAAQAKSKPVASAAEQLGPWQYIGPFEGGSKSAFDEAYPPETEIDLTKTYGKCKWVVHPEWADGSVVDLSVPGNSAVYLYRTITSPTAKTITGYFGSDDGMAMWFNGKKLISNNVARGASANQDTAKLELQAGENKLLFKVHNQGGGCGFYFSTNATPGGAPNEGAIRRDALWRWLQNDFRDSVSQNEMNWERQDSIWAQDWPADAAGTFVQRLAAATRGPLAAEAKQQVSSVKSVADLAALRKTYYRARTMEDAQARWKDSSLKALRMAIEDLSQTNGDKYPKGAEYLQRLTEVEKAFADARGADGKFASLDKFLEASQRFEALRAEALLANPLLSFEKMLAVQRHPKQMGLPQNWQGNSSIGRNGYDNQIVTVSVPRVAPASLPAGTEAGATVHTVFKPEKGEFVGDIDLHFDADRMLFSMPVDGRFQVCEMKTDGSGFRQVTPGEHKDVDNYDGCYLPDGRMIFCSTGCFHGVPCVGGGDAVGNLYRMETDGKTIRQLCFDQDHNWCPTLLNNGQVMYTRWEYSDTAHYFTRILFHMNPDGTGQVEYYGSNSYWPNSIFYARPIPNHPTKLVAIISGHHGVPRMGELLVFDPAKGRHEDNGAVQRIPGCGQPVEPIIRDTLVDGSWPKFLHPWPLSDKYFLVAAQPTPQSMWGIYLVDTFDNMQLLCETPGYAMLEPIPLRPTVRPPVIPDKIDTTKKDATVYISDIYEGATQGVPRGTIKKLRIYSPHYGYNGMGGHINIGIDGPWDVHRILGTVPVEEDGSAGFKVPANTPIAIQPLDADGSAVQLMRSWYTAMPGEVTACVGCHEQQTTSPPRSKTYAALKPAVEITPWYGPARGLSFKRDVQPVLDRYCVGCHDGKPGADGKTPPDFAVKDKPGWRNFDAPYVALHPYVRRPGPESDYHVFVPMEYHSNTSELVQMLKKGHYNVKLDTEAWDRLVTWIDLNVPDHGTWHEHRGGGGDFQKRRLALRTQYAGRDEDPEAIPDLKQEPVKYVAPAPMAARAEQKIDCAGWPFDTAEAKKKQEAAGLPTEMKVELAENVALNLALIPAGEFVMGDAKGEADEVPLTKVKIDSAFYIGGCEITNQQYALFDPLHDSAYISVFNKDQGNRGEAANRSTQPVIRVSWQRAMDFCKWLSGKTGKNITLPTEAQWEYACRAGTTTPLSYGACETDFGKLANLADKNLVNLCRGDSPKWIPHIAAVNDGSCVTDNVGKYQPNAWGLHDMHGNVAEWTLSTYKPYPYDTKDGRDDGKIEGEKVVRGGSFYDRPNRARSAFRLSYPSWQRVFNVGFRVICKPKDDRTVQK
ncbi:MAG TPA: SUMF1/EgtB/PvdO family nonheme iron enzyme [Planctomycetota bacterium]|jgi:formylglycine-generating enzyme required for sulfatase activity